MTTRIEAPRSSSVVTAAMAAAITLSSAWATGQVPAGPDSVLLSEEQGSDNGMWPGAAALPNGDFIVVWNHSVQGGTVRDVHGRRIDRRGALLGDEFPINTFTTGLQMQRTARPAIDARGNVVVVWDNYESGFGEVKGQRYSSDGMPRGLEFRVDSLAEVPEAPRVAAAADGRFVVVWWTHTSQVRARRFDASGAPIGSEFAVNTVLTAPAYHDVAVKPDGSFVVAWTSHAEGSFGIRLRRIDATGVPLGSEFAANTYTTDLQFMPSLAMAADGRFVLAWTSRGQDGDGDGVFARRFDADGTPLGPEFAVNTYTPLDQVYPSVAADERGNFVITWNEQMGPTSRTRGRRFSADGTPRGPEFAVADGLPGQFTPPSVTSDPVGNFLVAFTSPFHNGGTAPLARRYQGLVPEGLVVNDSPGDGNGVFDPGEWVHVGPVWHNVNGSAQTIAGSAAFSGPAGATYTILSASATYGTLPDDVLAGCSLCYAVAVDDPAARPASHWDTVLEEHLLPDAQGQVKLWRLHVGHSFSDVSAASPFYRFVEVLLHHGITAGCGPGRFCPQGAATREQMATFVLLAKEGAAYTPPACASPLFNDVPPSSPFCPWIEELARRGVVQGCGGGSYCPTDAVTREQVAVFLLRALDPTLTPPACAAPNLFADVPESSPFCPWIEELARRGITAGCAGGNYCPAQPVTREQMGAFLGATFGLALYGV